MSKIFVAAFAVLGILIANTALPVNLQPIEIVQKVEAAVRVKGYYRKNGTYVQPHYRSNPDGNPYNNWSFPGNTNPYTGKTATGNPDTYLKNYYNRSGNTNSYTYPYTAPSISTTPSPKINIPANAQLNYFGDGYICNSGYKKNYSTGQCDKVIVPMNAQLNYFGDGYICNSGFKKNYNTGACEAVQIPANAQLNYFGDGYICNNGYKKNYSMGSCERVITPSNAHLNYFGDDFTCDDGYRRVTDSCIPN